MNATRNRAKCPTCHRLRAEHDYPGGRAAGDPSCLHCRRQMRKAPAQLRKAMRQLEAWKAMKV